MQPLRRETLLRQESCTPHASNAAPNSPYNKANEIIIKLSDKNATQALDSQSSGDIIERINEFLKIKKITDMDIQAARKLCSGDIAVHTTNDVKTKSSWTMTLGRRF